MSLYFDICHNCTKFKYFDSLSNHELGKCIHYKTKIENPIFSEIDEIFNEYISHFYKIFDFYLVKCEFEVEFINLNIVDFIKTENFFNTSFINMKNYLVYHLYHTISNF